MPSSPHFRLSSSRPHLPTLFRALITRTLLTCAGVLAVVGASACHRDGPALPSDVLESAPPAPPGELSRFSAPLDYDFTTVLRVIERVVPTRFGSMDSIRMVGDDSHLHYAYAAERSPFNAFADGKLVHLRATLAYSARGYFKPIVGPTISAGCGAGLVKPRIEVELSTPLTLDSVWHLKSHASLERIVPASVEARDRCDVSILRRDVTGRVIDAAKEGLVTHLKDIDKKISDVDLRERFVSWWGTLAKPIRLTDGVWLLLRPQRLSIGAVTGHEHVLTIPVTLEARPEIVTTTTEPSADTIPLPTLGRDSVVRGFHISLDGVVDYAAAAAAVDKALSGKQVTKANRTINVTNVTVTPANKGQLALTVAFTGDARGALRFTGTPIYDPRLRVVTVPDLDYDLATDDGLISVYSWLRSDDMRATFREKATFPVDSALSTGRTLLLAGLNRTIGNVLTLKATVDSVGVRGLYVTRGGIVVRALATGHANVVVTPH